jgi:hypothetical protein
MPNDEYRGTRTMRFDPNKHLLRSIRLVLGRIEPGQPAVGWIKRSGSTMDLTMGIVVDPSASGRLDPPYWLAFAKR